MLTSSCLFQLFGRVRVNMNRETTFFQSEVTSNGHSFELRIGECGEWGGQVDGDFLLLEALEEMVCVDLLAIAVLELLFQLDDKWLWIEHKTKRMKAFKYFICVSLRDPACCSLVSLKEFLPIFFILFSLFFPYEKNNN